MPPSHGPTLFGVTDPADLFQFLSAAPSPYHAVAEAARRLEARRWQRLGLTDTWPDQPGRFYVRRGGALLAWDTTLAPAPDLPWRIVGAHTDSPNLRIKPRPDIGSAGWRQLGVEVYGGALWNSWLDRDLGLSGRVSVAGAEGPEERLVLVDEPLLRIPQLAIHLDRDVNGGGLKLNPQQHLTPVWGVGPVSPGDFDRFIAGRLDVESDAILGWDLMLHDLTPPTLLGRDQELIASARLDNLLSCWAGIEALITRAEEAESHLDPVPIGAAGLVCLFDHEEVGSTSADGAAGTLLAQVLERSVRARGGDRDDLLRSLAGSVCASVDMAHATHPNYPERHDPGHPVRVDGGPVIKVNANHRYATDAGSAAHLVEACRRAGVAHQVFVSRNDQPCGSTIGPTTAAGLGIPTVDVGVAQLSMHSARELCGASDPFLLRRALTSFMSP